MVACGTGSAPTQHDVTVGEMDGTDGEKSVFENMNKLRINTPKREVNKAELGCVEKEYDSHVHWGTPLVHDVLTPTTIRFTKASFQEMAGEFECSGTAGLMIHYGANDANKTLSLAYSMVCMTLDEEEEGTYGEDIHLYVTDSAGSLVKFGFATSIWQDEQGKDFQENVVVDSYDDSLFRYIYKEINGHSIHKVTEIDELIEHNELVDTDFVEVVPIAEPLVWAKTDRGAGFIMRTCLVAVKDNSRRITSDPQTPPNGRLTDRGTDLGAVCPPLCNDVAFPQYGVAIRKGCP